MGLSLAHQIVERARGHIDIKSEPGSGTTIIVRLPASSSADAK
jgi:signal transduction histidine kinase